MPTRWHFGDVIRKAMENHLPPLDNSQFAELSGLGINTVGNLVSGRVQSSTDTQEKAARAIGRTREDILAEVDRLNSSNNVVPIRSGKDREEDRDPVLREAIDYGRRISRLEPIARMSVYSFVAQLEQWAERVRRVEEREHDRQNQKA